jgi:hypothetical protein
MFKEYDVVIANKNINEVPKGSVGTVLIVYESNNDFEVEFIDVKGQTLAVLTVSGSDLESQS